LDTGQSGQPWQILSGVCAPNDNNISLLKTTHRENRTAAVYPEFFGSFYWLIQLTAFIRKPVF
jgi:hypothetical protein